jgi:thymidylate synthase ThyX
MMPAPDASHVSTHDLTEDDRARLTPYVSDTEGPVFVLTNLPETVKGALFARYSRSPKSLRRLLLDEFLTDDDQALQAAGPGQSQADALYNRMLAEYGDDSVAQLGGAHVAVEGASNVLTKILQWGRLASYLEQSTRYIAYTDRPGGQWRYYTPPDVAAHPEVGSLYSATLDHAFEVYSELLPVMTAYWDAQVPVDDTPPAARARAIRARALDSLRGLLPAATRSNVGIFASGHAYEALLIRLFAHPLPEAQEAGRRILTQLRTVIPAFVSRVDRPDRGLLHAAYLHDTEAATAAQGAALLSPMSPQPQPPEVRLCEWDPDGEAKVVAHALWSSAHRSYEDVAREVAGMSSEQRRHVLDAYCGTRTDRRHTPGRALEATSYTFEVVCDYGAYRDLQRHRMLTLQVQPLGVELGWSLPDEITDAHLNDQYATVMHESATLYRALRSVVPDAGPYAVSLAHRIRFMMVLNAREAMHVIELRSQPQGHVSYREVAQQMHTAIAQAGHTAIAEMMIFTDHSRSDAGRMNAERRLEARRAMRDAEQPR